MTNKGLEASSVLKKLAGDRRGSVATITALALVPIMIAAGAGLDISRALSSRSSLQDALDATALALAHMPPGTDPKVLKAKGDEWMDANLLSKGIDGVTLTVTPSKGQIVLSAAGVVPTTLSAIAGFTEVPISASSTVKWGLAHVEIALVLDNTGSMAGEKIKTLKAAATELVTTLQTTSDTTDPQSLKVAVVPFSHTVNIGSTFKSETWIDPTAAGFAKDIFTTPNTDRFKMMANLGKTWKGCIESRVTPYDVQDTAPSTGTASSLFVPYFAPDEPDDKDKNGDDVYPNSYMPDRTSDTNWSVKQGNLIKYAPVTETFYNCGTKKKPKTCSNNDGYDPASKVSGNGPNDGCDLTTVLRLTTSMPTVKSKISQMVATGNTNVAIGMMWGWHALSPNAPLHDGVAYTTEATKKIMVVLTDGDNTNSTTSNANKNNSTYAGVGYIWQDRLGVGSSSSAAQRTTAMDTRMATLCTNAKTAGIIIYTVRIDMAGTASPLTLMNCATDGQFYDVPDVANLSAAFDSIAGSIGKLRIAK